MNEMQARVLFVILMVWTATAVYFTTGWANGRIVMKRPTLSAIAEGLGIKTNRKTATEAGRTATTNRWIDLVIHHGFEKALRGVVNDLRNGGWWTRSDSGWYYKIESAIHAIECIPRHIGQALEQIKSSLECGCHQNPLGSAASCAEVIEMTIAELVKKYGVFDLPRLAVMQYPSLHTMTPEQKKHAVRVERDVVFTECCGELPTTRRYAGGSPQVVYCDKCDRELYDDIGC